jgi:hypothetical protein
MGLWGSYAHEHWAGRSATPMLGATHGVNANAAMVEYFGIKQGLVLVSAGHDKAV